MGYEADVIVSIGANLKTSASRMTGRDLRKRRKH